MNNYKKVAVYFILSFSLLGFLGLSLFFFSPTRAVNELVVSASLTQTGDEPVALIHLAQAVNKHLVLILPARAANESILSIPSIPLAQAADEIISTSVSTSDSAATSTPISEPAKRLIKHSVPFTSQAPLFEWSDPRQEDGCEEAVALMARAWIKGEGGAEAAVWRERILTLADWEQEKYGENLDVSLFHTLVWMFGDYFKHGNAAIKSVKSVAEILAELEKGHLVLAPMNGQALNNPYFTAPGPERHIILIKGYDYDSEEFITNDPGTRWGEDYRYPAAVIFSAIRPYATGYHAPFPGGEKEMIVVGK